VTAATLSAWREASLATRSALETELLEAKIALLESGRPLAQRRLFIPE
jgi:hypothetical protein